ncbi:hypothetical protein I6N95_17265 [Vagococcus sp. BWB3-3]|uniref:Uncharacterized protein n=1 Tax=Vagococcus allomyrinae TaxID=2794353 RepID=A0A940P816_9ENTE|nr:hypothetical protein [Vagococcus allomyrinae]MBP1042770.1 hypothetical protein [Vagococcus allomyrinae]
MLNINDITFNDHMILKGGKFILVQLLPAYSDVAGVGNESVRIGSKMTVALTAHQLKKIEVIIEDIVVCSPFNDLQLAEVVFSDFEGSFKFDKDSKEYVLHATASRFKLVNESHL